MSDTSLSALADHLEAAYAADIEQLQEEVSALSRTMHDLHDGTIELEKKNTELCKERDRYRQALRDIATTYSTRPGDEQERLGSARRIARRALAEGDDPK